MRSEHRKVSVGQEVIPTSPPLAKQPVSGGQRSPQQAWSLEHNGAHFGRLCNCVSCLVSVSQLSGGCARLEGEVKREASRVSSGGKRPI